MLSKNLFNLFILLTFLFIFASVPHKIYAASFEDNFDNGNLDNWEVINDSNPCNGQWQIQNGMAGFIINNQFSCTTNLTPKDSVWQNIGNNYSFDVDMKFVNGTDHNLTYRFLPNPPNNSGYELHFQTPGDFSMGPIGTFITNIPKSYSNGQTYHIQIVINDKDIKVLIDEELVREVTLNNPLPPGKIALRVGTGSDPNAESWFDNVKVTSLADSSPSLLDVPYFSQNALPWGTQEYDHSSSLGFSSPFMNRWGCAVTSAAMVLRYYSINQLPDGTSIDPGSLNSWLNQRADGYITGYGSGGSYSYLNWSAISSLTRDLFAAGKASMELEYQGLRTDSSNFSSVNGVLDDDLQTKSAPDILWVSNASTSGHFVVAKGKSGSDYAINDPEWNVPSLTSFTNTYMQLGRYIPAHSDLSYLVFVVNPSVDILLTNSDGKKSGAFWNQGVKQSFQEIAGVDYGFDAPLSNPNAKNITETLGTGENVLTYPKLSEGTYTITLSSNNLQPFTVNLIAYDRQGGSTVKKLYGFTDKGKTVVIPLAYSQTQASTFGVPLVSFASTLNDINMADKAGFINHLVALGLVQLVQNSQKLASQGKKLQARFLLDQAVVLLNFSKKLIAPVAYELILADLNSLKVSL